ncbi:MAG: nucleoside phosphorylase [Oscillospiraceae bacterium]|nr:nucleoside phosphorylase [Oscillospiraceae bacterium]
MPFQNHPIPILEYDADPSAVFLPNHEQNGLQLPERAVFAFLGDAVEQYAKAHHAVRVSEFVSISKTYPFYVLEAEGQQICLTEAPVGAPAATMILDCLIACGVRKIITGGSCGVLEPMRENAFLIPRKALRDEGTSYHYLPPERYIAIPEQARAAIRKALEQRHLPYSEVVTWTTDGFFRETREAVMCRRAEGCSVVEMECAALAACAQFRGALWGELLFTADSLADAEHYDERNWGRDSVAGALGLCVEAVLHL